MNHAALLSLFLCSSLCADVTFVFVEEFTGGVYANDGWVPWNAPWGSSASLDLTADSAALSVPGRNGSCGIAILIDLSAHQGKTMTLGGEWAGAAAGSAWVEVMWYQTDSDDMANQSSANFDTFDFPGMTDIAIKHDSFGLPDTTWGPQSFGADAVNNGASAGFGGLTQVVSQPYCVLALKVGNDGTMTGLDNLNITVPADPPQAEVVVTSAGFNGGAFEIAASGLDPARSYLLRRTKDGESFTDVGDPFTGSENHVFADPAPPAGAAPTLYQIWETAP